MAKLKIMKEDISKLNELNASFTNLAAATAEAAFRLNDFVAIKKALDSMQKRKFRRKFRS